MTTSFQTPQQLSETQVRCINLIEHQGAMTAGQLARAILSRETAIDMALADLLLDSTGPITRTRNSEGLLVYSMRGRTQAMPAPAAAPAPTAPPTTKRGGPAIGSNNARLPPLDIGALQVMLAPKLTRQAARGGCKWSPLFERLAAIKPADGKHPTVNVDPIYGGSIAKAMRKWMKRTGTARGVQLTISRAGQRCTLQRVA